MANVSDTSSIECQAVHHVNSSFTCAFVTATDDCNPDSGLLNYNEVIYCTFGVELLALATLILLTWWMLLFVTLAVTADDFFCPNLQVISKTLRMSDNIAGVTLLAFGNGAPDVFSSISAVTNMKGDDAGLALGALLGAGIFVTTMVAGSVTLAHPFHAAERPFLRDVIFYISAAFYLFVILYDGFISTWEAAGMLIMYLGYVVIVVVGRYIYQKLKKSKKFKAILSSSSDEEPVFQNYGGMDHTIINHKTEPETRVGNAGAANHINPSRAVKSLLEASEVVVVSSSFGNENVTNPTLQPVISVSDLHEDSEDLVVTSDDDELLDLRIQFAMDEKLLDTDDSSCKSCWSKWYKPKVVKEFFMALNPIDVECWRAKAWYGKFYDIFKAVPLFCLRLTVPVVDLTEDKEQWNRHLRCLNCITSPLLTVVGLNLTYALYEINHTVPVWALLLVLGFICAVIVYNTSVNDEPPVYHPVFSFLGFIIAIVWIQTVANEIVNLLQAFGVAFSLSSAILGITFLAWGNSIGDLVSNVTMARQGFPRAGISACYGGPMFNLLLGIGIPFLIKCISEGGTVNLSFELIQELMFAALFLCLTSSLVVVPLLKFNFKRWFAIYLFVLYSIFIVLAILIESNIITS